MTIAEAMTLLSPRIMSRLREHAKAVGVDEAKVASDLLEMMAQDACPRWLQTAASTMKRERDVQAERAEEAGDWAAKVLICVGFFSLLLVIAIAVGRLSWAAALCPDE
jgi:hypothetical protein